MGLQSSCKDLGFTYKLRIHSDATAAIGIARRRGMGKIRHLDVTDLWIQEKFHSTYAFIHNVFGTENPADVLTTYTDEAILHMALDKMGIHYMSGRSEIPPAAMGTSANADPSSQGV